VAKKAKQRGPGKRYTPAEKAKILAAAKKEGLTGEQVTKRFGVSGFTFYRWRGPVKGKTVKLLRLAATGKVHVDQGAVRKAVRAEVKRLLPQIIREEIETALR
jgi:transposase-like protein